MKSCVLIVDDHAIIRRMLHALLEADDIAARLKMVPKVFRKLKS